MQVYQNDYTHVRKNINKIQIRTCLCFFIHYPLNRIQNSMFVAQLLYLDLSYNTNLSNLMIKIKHKQNLYKHLSSSLTTRHHITMDEVKCDTDEKFKSSLLLGLDKTKTMGQLLNVTSD